MTLFDSLRWPIISIFDEDSLSQLPEDLFSNWLNKCYKESGTVIVNTKFKRTTHVDFLIHVRGNYFGWSMHLKDELIALYTQYLKDMIAEYECCASI